MITLKERFCKKLSTDKGGLLVFILAAISTAAVVLCPGVKSISGFASGASGLALAVSPASLLPAPSVEQVTVKGTLSHSKVVEGDASALYLKVEVQTPQAPSAISRRLPADVVVVLDRSGSMADANKLPYAKSAIIDLLGRLSPEDRFALVTFDSSAQVRSSLGPVSNEARSRITAMVSQLQPGGSTNMSEGLSMAHSILNGIAQEDSPRSRRVLLLSDGHANAGDSSISGLTHYVNNLKYKSAVVSTIGMGLGFNEALLATLADNGMGNYSFLEDLSMLGAIFAKDLSDARNMLAESSTVRIALGDGVTLQDAAGYPVEYESGNPRMVRIPTGQLLSGSAKNFTLTFNTHGPARGNRSIGGVTFNYVSAGKNSEIAIANDALAYEVVEPSRRKEAFASIKPEIWEHTWTHNNSGIMQRDLNSALAEGNKEKAWKVYSDYNAALKKAEDESGLNLRKGELDHQLVQIEEKLNDAFTGPAAEQHVKQNRYAKDALSHSREAQRMGR